MFDPEIPILTEQQRREDGALNVLKRKFSHYDQNYVANACFPDTRDVLIEAYKECQPFLDEAFHIEIRQPGKFFARLWEMHTCSLLLHWGLNVQPRANKKKSIPDFQINDGRQRIWVEAICPDLGEVDSAPPHPELKSGEIFTRTVDIATDNRPRVLRASSALDSKIKKYKEKYLLSGVVNESDAYVVAINTERICWHNSTMVEEQLLYGMGLHQINIRTGEGSRQWVPEAIKQVGSSNVIVPIAYFVRPEYKFISACIFSNRWFEFSPDWKKELSRHAHTYFNENAKNPIRLEYLPSGSRTHSVTIEREIRLERIK